MDSSPFSNEYAKLVENKQIESHAKINFLFFQVKISSPFEQCFSWPCVSLIPTIHTITSNWHEPHWFVTMADESFRAMLFLAMRFSCVIPTIHTITSNWHEPHWFVTMADELVMAFFYALGTFFYVSRMPERWKPRWFDIVGHNHHIFHLFVIVGALAHYGATLVFLEWHYRKSCDMLG